MFSVLVISRFALVNTLWILTLALQLYTLFLLFLLRAAQDYRGFYDRKKLFWKDIVDATLMCCSAPPGGGRNELTPRFVRHFHVLCVPQPSDGVMAKIYGSILKSFLSASNFKRDVIELRYTLSAESHLQHQP